MSTTLEIAAVDVDAVLADPGREPASGPARIRIEGGRIAAFDAFSGGPCGTIAIAAPSNAHDHGRGLRPFAFGALDDALETWLPTLGREPRVSAYRRAAVAFARMAEGGIAATNHAHNPQDESALLEEAEAVARAAHDVGIHVAFAVPFKDRNPLVYGDQARFLDLADASLRSRLEARLRTGRSIGDYLHLVDEIAALAHESFSVQYCPVGPQWVSDASLAAIAEASALSGRRVHMHLLETRFQREWADAAYPGGIVRRLDELGLLSPRLSIAHGIYLTEDECALLAERGVVVSVNTSSNLRLRSGIAPVERFIRRGLAFGIGLDANPMEDDDDILREMRLVWLHHRGIGLDDVLSAERLFRAAAVDGRRAVRGDDGGGKLIVGAPADLLVLDHAAMSTDVLSAAQDPVATLLTRATRKHIKQLIVGGRVLVEDGLCVTVDRARLEAELVAEARASWAASPPDERAAAQLDRAIRHFYGCAGHTDTV
ncbi:amidohydrolase family protein [Polyangium sp. 15x6]|uniref:amidohydrolase family protein n=1 Tax=Polyangium sp. 15x6 TaxID=3042687 RepID=UPI00249BECF3|nr:amidohydrolase family protein [Polyangium sp. 15x6]MDI3288734.1 amidohydrolase family protein [Polyangium sp. 15x6]